MDSRNQLRVQRGLEDASRLVDAEISLVAEDVTEASARLVCLGAPSGHILGVLAKLGAPVRRKGVRGEEGDLDSRQVRALTKAAENARCLQLPVMLEVIPRFRFHRRRSAVEPQPQPLRGRLL